LNIYINNINKDLLEADELVVKYLILDSAKHLSYELNLFSRDSGESLTERQVVAHEKNIDGAKEYGSRMATRFREFANQRLTKIDSLRINSDTTLLGIEKVFVAYDATEFGWVNVDYFYRDPRAKDIKFCVKVNGPGQLINLIIPSRNVILSGTCEERGVYYFNKNQSDSIKLPEGELAFLVAIGIKDNQIYFTKKRIVIGQKEIEELELNITTSKEVMSSLTDWL
jgi:hypothetical protein